MTNTKPYALVLVAVVVSFLGFCVENIFTGIRRGFISNKNMILPFLWGYGLTILAIYFLFGTPQHPLFFRKKISFESNISNCFYYFIIAFLCVCLGEIILGYAVEYICKIVWWDYTTIPLHITKYTSVPTSAGFALLITVFMRYFFYPLLSQFLKIPSSTLKSLAIVLAVALSLDMINSAIYMLKNHDLMTIWQYEFKKLSKDIIAPLSRKI